MLVKTNQGLRTSCLLAKHVPFHIDKPIRIDGARSQTWWLLNAGFTLCTCVGQSEVYPYHMYIIYIYLHTYMYIYLLTLVSTLQYVKWWELCGQEKNIMINHKHINICRTCKFLPYLCFLKQPQFPQLFPEHHRSSPAESHGHKEILIIESFSRWSKTPKSQ